MGTEALTIEGDSPSSNRENGFFLSKFSVFVLCCLFVAALVTTGILVYYLSDKSGPEHAITEHVQLPN